MSIASELTNLAANKAAIKAAIAAQNPSVMPTDVLSQWPTSIASIGGGGHEGWIYGYVIDESNPDPAARVTYIEDNAEFSPLYMDFANDQLVWGSWKSWVEEYFRPAMLRSDGTIDYYLDPDDLTKKADGTASDVSNTSYDGNAMLIVKPIFYNISRIGPKQIRVRFSNVKQDADWFCWTHLKSDGTYADFCGWALFGGCKVDSKLRSMATQSVPTKADSIHKLSDALTYAANNGSGWYTTTYADELMLRMLFPLLCKTTDSQAVFGGGTGRGSATLKCGSLVDKGYFWGTADLGSTSVGSKFLGIENVWGELWRRPCGVITDNRLGLFVKLTPSGIDGTGVTTFTQSTGDYLKAGGLPYGQGLGIVGMHADVLCPLIPLHVSGNDYTRAYADMSYVNDVASVMVFGGSAAQSGARACGIFAVDASLADGTQYWAYSSPISYHFF